MDTIETGHKVFFLDDRPKLSLQEEDAFGHLYYARALFRILESSHSVESHAIGLFGIWGVGKTSIINELQRILSGKAENDPKTFRHKYKVAVLDTWQYSEDNFRREFLLDLASKFSCQEEIRSRLSTKRILQTKEAPRYDTQWAASLAKQLLLFGAAIVLFSFIFSSLLNQTKLISLAASLIISILTVLRDNIKSLFTFHTIIQETKPAVHPDEFRGLFRYIVRKKVSLKKDERLIIVLDNLDRVKESVVLQILAAVKTFLDEDKCVYILPCDDKGLKQHIRNTRTGTASDSPMSEADATEYLRKFFQTSLTIRDLLSEELDTFTRDVLQKMAIFDIPILNPNGEPFPDDADIRKRNFDEVSAVFRVAIARNPRRIILLANKLAANYLIAEEKREIDPQLTSNITSHLGFLAKLTVIEEEWPTFYSLILQYPDLLSSLQTYLITDREDALPRFLSEYLGGNAEQTKLQHEWEKGLKDFLLRTNHIHAPHIPDFLYFKQRPSARQISDYYSFREAALNGNIDIVERIIKHKDTDITAAFRVLADELETYSRLQDTPTVTNILKCIVSSVHLIPDHLPSLRRSAANSVAEKLSLIQFSPIAFEIPLDDLLQTLSESSRDSNRAQILKYLIGVIDLSQDIEKSLHIIEALANHRQLLNEANRAHFRQLIEAASSEPSLVDPLRRIAHIFLQRNDGDINQFIPQSLYRQNIALLGTADKNARAALEFLADFFPGFDDASASQLAEQIQQHLTTITDPPQPAYEFALDALQLIPPEVIPSPNKSSIVQLLDQGFRSFSSQAHKFAVTRAYLYMLPAIDTEDQQKFHPELIAAIQISDAKLLQEIMASIQSKGQETFKLDEVLAALRKRSVDHVSNSTVRHQFFSLSKELDAKSQINEYVVSIVNNQDQLEQALTDAEEYLSAKEFRVLLRQILDQLDNLPEHQIANVLTLLGSFSRCFNKEFRADTTEIILNKWLRRPSLPIRQAARKLWTSYRESTSTSVRTKFYERLIELAARAIEDGTISQEENLLYVHVLIDDYTLLSETIRKELVDLLLRMREQGRPTPIRERGYTLLRSLHNAPHAQHKVPRELIEDLEHEIEIELIRSILDALLQYKSMLSHSQVDAIRRILAREDSPPVFAEYRGQWNHHDLESEDNSQ